MTKAPDVRQHICDAKLGRLSQAKFSFPSLACRNRKNWFQIRHWLDSDWLSVSLWFIKSNVLRFHVSQWKANERENWECCVLLQLCAFYSSYTRISPIFSFLPFSSLVNSGQPAFFCVLCQKRFGSSTWVKMIFKTLCFCLPECNSSWCECLFKETEAAFLERSPVLGFCPVSSGGCLFIWPSATLASFRPHFYWWGFELNGFSHYRAIDGHIVLIKITLMPEVQS